MLIDVKFDSDLLNQPKQYYNLHVVKDAHQNRFTSDFSAFSNSRKSVRWSAVPVAPKLVHVGCEGERGSGPEGADDLCWARS